MMRAKTELSRHNQRIVALGVFAVAASMTLIWIYAFWVAPGL